MNRSSSQRVAPKQRQVGGAGVIRRRIAATFHQARPLALARPAGAGSRGYSRIGVFTAKVPILAGRRRRTVLIRLSAQMRSLIHGLMIPPIEPGPGALQPVVPGFQQRRCSPSMAAPSRRTNRAYSGYARRATPPRDASAGWRTVRRPCAHRAAANETARLSADGSATGSRDITHAIRSSMLLNLAIPHPGPV